MPYVEKTECTIVVQFRPVASASRRTIETECLVDRDRFGDIVGIDFVHLACEAGDHVFDGFDFDGFSRVVGARTSYDSVADALFIQLPRDPFVPYDRSYWVPCTLMLVGKGRLLRMEVHLPEQPQPGG